MSSELVAFIFKLLDFAVLVSATGYLIARYGLPMFRTGMAKKKREHKEALGALRDAELALEGEQDLAKEQEAFCRRFSANVEVWRASVERETKAVQLERSRRCQQAQELRNARFQNYMKTSTEKLHLASLFDKVDVALKGYFSIRENRGRYLEDLIKKLAKEGR